MKSIKQSLWAVLAMSVLAGACKKDEQNVTPTDDNEAITTATLQLVNKANASEVVTATIENLNTSADFSKATLTLKANTTYSGTIQLVNKTKTPTIDVSAEIKSEQNEHLLVYTPSVATLLTVTITDKDTNPSPGPYPVGLTFDLKTNAVATGKLNVRLRHQPGAKNGTQTPGTDDLNTDFSVVIQ
ncbi:hypothetical protein IC229_07200 [Spirosoma sp. BT702]|uniref:Uncharacterized protein n=1 Tax=Spirosoma profusum TaxID=2771354 RepID=A0A926XU21_9BACT|nr:hypothetical protein [Spirosoma profusum]MBD2700414.1 hypothetical protein [Spirosoma profusum]